MKFEDERQACEILTRGGIEIIEGCVNSKKPKTDITLDEWDAIAYLMQEYDYYYEETP